MDSGLQALQNAIAAAIHGMSHEQLTSHPDGKWSTAEVLEHLYLTYRGSVKGFEKCLKEGKTIARNPQFMDRIRASVVVGLGYMPEGRKAPERSTPRGMRAEDVIKAIGPELAAMDNAISQCESRFGSNTRLVDHPVLGPLNARQWRKFHCLHGRHHVKQIWKLREGGL
jgi:Protein of unknown function (DUF1569)